MRRTWVTGSVLLLALLGGQVSVAQTTTVAFDRLTFALPGSWETQPGDERLTARWAQAAVALVVYPAVDRGEESAARLLAGAIAAYERGRTNVPEANSMDEPALGGAEPGGTPYLWQVRVTRGAEGHVTFAFFACFGIGARLQLVQLVADSPRAFTRAMSEVTPAFARVARSGVEAPLRAAPLAQGQEVRAFHLMLRVPADWERVTTRSSNVAIFEVPVPFSEDGKSAYPVRVVFDVQARPPVDLQARVQARLRSGDVPTLGLELPAGTTPALTELVEARHASGHPLVRVGLEHRVAGGRWAARTFGWALEGPGGHLTATVALGTNQLPVSRGSDQIMIRNFPAAVAAVEAVIAGARWDGTPTPRPDLDAWLARRKRFRYQRQVSRFGSGVSFFSERRVEWSFHEDGTVDLDEENEAGVTSSHDNPTGGLPGFVSSYHTRAPLRGRARFRAVSAGGRTYVVLTHAGGVTTVHPATLKDDRFELDGLEDGTDERVD